MRRDDRRLDRRGRDRAHSLKQGTFGDILESVRVVFANGETAELGRVSPPDPDREPVDFLDSLTRRIWAIGRRNTDLIAEDAEISSKSVRIRTWASLEVRRIDQPGPLDRRLGRNLGDRDRGDFANGADLSGARGGILAVLSLGGRGARSWNVLRTPLRLAN